MTPHFITYFDSHYAAQGIAMLTSLRKWCPGVSVTVLCLDETIERILQWWFPDGLSTLTIAEMLESEPQLVELRESRTPWEFYATMKPMLIRRVMHAGAPPDGWVAFTDADTYFYSDPLEALAKIPADISTVLSPHRFSFDTAHLEVYGTYNAGFGLWRNHTHAHAVLQGWTAACLDWCFNRAEDGRFMNQGYLNAWPQTHEGVMVLGHPGFNVAPWNLGRHLILETPAGVTVDGLPLVFFHFSSVSRMEDGTWQTFYTNPEMDQLPVLRGIYAPYLEAVDTVSDRLLHEHQIAGVGTLRRLDPSTPMLRLRGPRIPRL